MENERKSVFDRLGPIGNKNNNATDLRNVVESKRRLQETIELENETKKIKLMDLANDNSSVSIEPVVVVKRDDNEPYEEGEILDDDVDVDPDEKVEAFAPIKNDSENKNVEESENQNCSVVVEESMSPISVDGNISGEDVDDNETFNDVDIVEPKSDVVEDNIEASNVDLNKNDETFYEDNNDDDREMDEEDKDNGSHYSDWSDGEDDLLQCESGLNNVTLDATIDIDSNTMDNSVDSEKAKLTDLELISDDDLDNDDIYADKNKDVENLISGDNKNQMDTINIKDMDESNMFLMFEIDLKDLINSPLTVSKDDIDTESQKKEHREKYLKRHSSISMLNRIGYNRTFAEEKLSNLIDQRLQQELGDEYQPMAAKTPCLHGYHLAKKRTRAHFFANNTFNGLQDRLFLKTINETELI